MPDGFRRADLAQAAAGETAADRKGQRAPLARGSKQRWDAEQDPDDRARVRSGEQTREKCARERQVERLVIEEQARDDTDHQRKPETRGEDKALGPVALLGQQDAPEPRKPDQHRRQDGAHGEFRHQGVQENLLADEARLGWHSGS